MKTSAALRNTTARNPSHLGSYRKGPSGNSAASFASIGSMGGATANGELTASRPASPRSGRLAPDPNGFASRSHEATTNNGVDPTELREPSRLRAFVIEVVNSALQLRDERIGLLKLQAACRRWTGRTAGRSPAVISLQRFHEIVLARALLDEARDASSHGLEIRSELHHI